MGESVCLARSFSQPAEISSHEVIIPRRVLTESVSFGRFASETLQWERWSAFTQNRYLEEVERFTKPGSVAEKKAFFEAHFKKRASGNKTKTKTQEGGTVVKTVCEVQKENLVCSEVPLVNVRRGEVSNAVKSSHETVCEVQKAKLFDSEVPLVNDVRHGEVSSAVKTSHETVCEVPEESLVDSEVKHREVSNAEEVKDTIAENFDVPEDEDLDKENSTSLSKERRPTSSGSKTCGRSSIPETSFSLGLDLPVKKPRKESLTTRIRSSSVLKNKNRSPPEPFHISINCAPSGNTDKKMPQKSSRSSKDALKADKKERSGSSSVHMPLNSAISAHQTTKPAPKKLARRSTTQETNSSNAGSSLKPKGNEPAVASKSRKRPLSRGAKEDSDAPKCSTRASAFRLPKPPPPLISRPSDEKRKNITVGSSVSCKIPNNVQRQPSASCENISTHSRTREKSFTVSTPFNFRSDERAEKRKEFFRKLEEKKKKEDAVKEQSSCDFQAPIISLTSPRFRRNQKSHKSPSNVASEKYKRCKVHPSLTKKKTQEDSSPNNL